MNIVIFAPLYGAGYGAGYAAYKETKYMHSKFNHNITVIHSQDRLGEYKICGIKYLFFQGPRGRSKLPIIEIFRLCKNVNHVFESLIDKPEVIYNQSLFLGFVKKRKIKGVKIVTFVRSTIRGGRRASVEDSSFNKFLKIFIYFFLEFLEKRVFNFSDVLIVKSEIMKSELTSIYGIHPEKIVIISGGVDNDFLGKKEPLNYNSKECIVFIGRIEPVKGLLRLIDAISLLDKDRFILKIAGGYQDARYFKRILRKISKYGLSNNVSFLGKINQKKVANLIANSKMVIMPSWYEPFGMVATQVANMKKPILVSDKVGAIDVLRNYEGLFVFRSNRELVSMMNKVIQSNLKISKKAKTPDWKSVANKINNILTS